MCQPSVSTSINLYFSGTLPFLNRAYQGEADDLSALHRHDSQGVVKENLAGYRTVRCSACQRQFNVRTSTSYNYLEFPPDIVLLVVLWRVRYKLCLSDLAEMFLERGFEFT